MPTSIQSFTTYIPRLQNDFNQDNSSTENPFVRELNVEDLQTSSSDDVVSVLNKRGQRVKILLALAAASGIILILVCTLVPILIGQSIITTTTAITISSTIVLSWNQTGTTAMGVTGQSGTGSNQLQRPFGLFVDSFNSLYIADAANHRVQKYLYNSSTGTTVAGQSSGTTGTGANFFRYCSDVAVDSNGNIYVADILNSRIQLWTNGSSTGTTAIGTGTAGTGNNSLNNPYGIALDSSSNRLYISDSSNNRIMRYTLGTSSGGVVIAGGNGNGTGTNQLSRPAGLYFDSSTNSLIIANSAANNIVRWVIGNNNWTLLIGNLNGSSGLTSTDLNFPGDVTLDSYGNIYVADTNNHRIQFYLSGQKNGTTIAGITNVLGSNATLLNYPRSVVLDNQQNLYVADTENHRIQKFSRL